MAYHSEEATWTGARSVCRMLDSELVIIDSKPEADWVGHRIGEYGSDTSVYWWVGLEYSTEGEAGWRWLDGQSVSPDLTSWAENHPAENSTGRCGGLLTSGLLTDQLCSDSGSVAKFVCERPLAAPPQCGEGWEHHQGACYKKYHDQDKVEWQAARAKCRQDPGADLVIINTEQENDYVKQFATDNHIDLWIGIYERVRDRGWMG